LPQKIKKLRKKLPGKIKIFLPRSTTPRVQTRLTSLHAVDFLRWS